MLQPILFEATSSFPLNFLCPRPTPPFSSPAHPLSIRAISRQRSARYNRFSLISVNCRHSEFGDEVYVSLSRRNYLGFSLFLNHTTSFDGIMHQQFELTICCLLSRSFYYRVIIEFEINFKKLFGMLYKYTRYNLTFKNVFKILIFHFKLES